MKKNKKLIIVGIGETANLAYYYFTNDTEYEVVAFAANKSYIIDDVKFNLPIVDIDNIEHTYDPTIYNAFVAASSNSLNTVRTNLYRIVKSKGYKLATYISPLVYIGQDVTIGENCFIMENNTIQSFVKIGNNVVLWSGNHIGHSSKIQDNCFISSHVVISGFVEIGRYTFIGVNSAIADNVKVGEKCLISMGSLIGKDVPDNTIMKMQYSKKYPLSTTSFFNIENFNF